MDDRTFQRLWWKFTDAATVTERKEIIRVAAAHHVFTVAQVVVLVSHFEHPTDRLDMLEVVLLRMTDLGKMKENLLTAFNERLRDYVTSMLKEKILDAVAADKFESLLVRQFATRSLSDMKKLRTSLSKPYYTTNQWEALDGLLNMQRLGFNYDQLFRLVRHVPSEELPRFLEMADKLCLGVTAREVVQIMTGLEESQRVEVLRILCGMVLDPERKWVIMDFGLKGCAKHTRAQAIEVLQDMLPYPRSPLVGTIRAKRVVFVVDTSSSMSCVFETNQHERIQRIRFVARDLSRVLKEQASPGTMFNVVSFAKDAVRCFNEGMRPLDAVTAERASMFLRMIRPEGPTNTLAAFVAAFDEDELDEIFLITDGKPSFSHSTITTKDAAVGLQAPDVMQEILRLRQSRGPEEAVPVHCTAVLAGFHPSDDVAGTMEFCQELATATGGLFRCVVHNSFVLFQTARPKPRAKLRPRQFVRRSYKGWVYQASIALSWLFMQVMLVLAREVKWGDQTSGDVSRKYPTYFTAHERAWWWYRAFAAWSAITVMKLCLPWRTSDGILRAFRFWWVAWCLLSALWPVAFQNEQFLLSCFIMLGMLVCSILLYRALEIGVREDPSFDEVFWVHIPAGSIMSWTSYTFMLNIAVYLKWWEWYGWGWQWEWALVLMVFYALLAIAMLVKTKDIGFPMTTVWVLANIVRSHWSYVYIRDQNEFGGVDYSYAFDLCTTGIVLATILTFVTALTASSRISRAMTKNSSVGQRRKNSKLISLQTSNFVAFGVMVIINLLSVRWGFESVGMSYPPFNRETCSSISFDAGTVRIMPAKWAFHLWPVIYLALLPFIVCQSLPTETTRPLAREKALRDDDLGKTVMIRGSRRERLFIGFCGERLRVVVPLIHRWQLTRRSQGIVEDKIGYLFFLSCALNIIWLINWQFKEHSVATFLITALMGVLALIYKRVDMHRLVMTAHEKEATADHEEEHRQALEKLRSKATDDAAGLVKEGKAGAEEDDDDDDVKEEKEKAAEDMDDEEAEIMEKAARKRIKLPPEPVTKWEKWVVHVPFSLYLGWVSWLMALNIAYVAKRDAWNGFGMTDSAWAVIIMSFMVLVCLFFTFKKHDPFFPIGTLVALYGIFWNHTTGTCPEYAADTMAGQHVLAEGYQVYWNITAAADCTYTDYLWVDGRCRHERTDVTDPLTCARLGSRGGGFVKGYSYIENHCVEDPGLCPYEFAKADSTSHMREYTIATAALTLFCLLALAVFAKTLLLIKRRLGLRKAVRKRWLEMMNLQ
mmetsp:Transcript_21402/g.69020  ORF Transcript_21402/g.69020 Transcript_21402/m.69020 type:complete len:1275 (-) Transcript_21402:65-3889(-)